MLKHRGPNPPSRWRGKEADGETTDETVNRRCAMSGDGTPVLDENKQPVTRQVRAEREIEVPAKVTERTHEPLRKFAARLGGPEDPLDLDKYINHWRTKRHLTSLPNEANFDPVKGLPTGAWIQRLIETVEIPAIHIAQVHERNKALEARITALEAANVPR